MRKGIHVLIAACVIILMAGSVMFLPKRENISPAPLAVKDLLINGRFKDGLNGWQIVGTGKPQYDFVTMPKIVDSAVGLTAEQHGSVRLSQQISADTTFARFRFKANFLSTRGNGQIHISVLDENKQTIATLGWIVVGDMPPSGSASKWYDLHVPQNYLGEWVTQDILLAEQLAQAFPHIDFSKIGGYQVDFLVTDGQHGILTDVQLVEVRRQALAIGIAAKQPAQTMGSDFTVTTSITNRDTQALKNVVVQGIEPYGWGLVLKEPSQRIDVLEPGESKTLSWNVKAQRPSQVNLGKPWEIAFRVEGEAQHFKSLVDVHDPHPGTIYYVLTDDLEPIDGAGYAKAYGNQNAWLDPEEFKIQLVQKAEKLNAIADTYGAKWSHYIAWTAVTGAEWAAAQSKSSAWQAATEAIKQSVKNQSAKGHEYAIHMHSDYDQRLPGNILRYNAETDGFWANHRRHGWAHNIPELGDFETLASRAGTLYEYQSQISALTRQSPLGQIIATRVGSFDFGDTPAEEAKSIEAYRRVGLLAGSDADGNLGRVTAGDFSHSLYLTKNDDINSVAQDLRQIGILQFRPNPVNYISYDTDKAAKLNQKVSVGVQIYLETGKVKPGVHAITGFTHTMFVMGSGDWRSLEGGQFEEINSHLAYVKNTYVQPGLMRFATSSEMTKAYWDYFTPTLLAVYGTEQEQGGGQYVYPLELIGRQLPVDERHIHNVSVKYPLYLREQAYKIEIRKNGQKIMQTWGLPTPFNDIIFPVDDASAKYTMHVYTDPLTGKAVKFLRWVYGKILLVKKIFI